MSFSISNSLFDSQTCDDVLTSSQLEMSFTLRSFCEEAASCSSILSLMTGQTVAAFAKGSLFKALSLSFGNGARKLAAYHYTSSIIACGAEGIAFNIAGEVGRAGELRLGSWKENLHGFFTIGACKLIGPRFGRSVILQHGSQDLGMMFVDITCESVGIAEVRQEGGVQRLLSAELATIRMGISARLTHAVCIEATYFQATAEISYKSSQTPSSSRGFLQAVRETFGRKPVSANEAPIDLLSELQEPESKGGDRFAMSIDSSEDPRRFFDGPETKKTGSAPNLGEKNPANQAKPTTVSTERLVALTFAAFINDGKYSAADYAEHARQTLTGTPEITALLPEGEEARSILIARVIQAGRIAFPGRQGLCKTYGLQAQAPEIQLVRVEALPPASHSPRPERDPLPPTRRSTTARERPAQLEKTLSPAELERQALLKDAEAKLATLREVYGFEISPKLSRDITNALIRFADYIKEHPIEEDARSARFQVIEQALPHEKIWFGEWVSLFYFSRNLSADHLRVVLGTARLLQRVNHKIMDRHGFSERDQEVEEGKATCRRGEWREVVDLYTPTDRFSDLTRRRLSRSYAATHFPELTVGELPYAEEEAIILSKMPGNQNPPQEPRKKKTRTISFIETLEQTQARWKLPTKTDLASWLGITRSTLTSYFDGCLPLLPSFYSLVSKIERVDQEKSRERRKALDHAALMKRRVEYYLGCQPGAGKLNFIDPEGKEMIITVPEGETPFWDHQKFLTTPFGELVAQIEQEAAELGFSRQKFADELGELKGSVHNFKTGIVKEVRWDFIERLARFSAKHLKNKYHLSFIAARARPEIFNLATRIINQNDELIRRVYPIEPLNYESDYRTRLEKREI